MSEDYKKDVRQRLLDRATFVRATFSDPSPSSKDWKKVIVRPVLVREKPVWQFSYFDARRDISKNYDSKQAPAMVDDLLGLDFRQITVETTGAILRVARGASGKPKVRETSRDAAADPPDVRHDRRNKEAALPADSPDRFLQAIGVATAEGAIKAGKQDKHRQINDFLKLVRESLQASMSPLAPLSLVDCGCGAAYLTFAAYHYLSGAVEAPVTMVGVDVRADLIARHDDVVRALDWDGLSFNSSPIAGYRPATPPDIVLALHACDTATDDALAGGVLWNSRFIFSAPCCHHHLQAQLDAAGAPALFAPVYRHGILAERMGDILTDALRALILRVMGYKTDVVEFVSGEHTARNIMIRAVRADLPPAVRATAAREYRDLTAFWGVTPYLATLLGKTFETVMASALESERRPL